MIEIDDEHLCFWCCLAGTKLSVQNMLDTGILQGIEQVFRQTPAASHAHVAAAQLLVCSSYELVHYNCHCASHVHTAISVSVEVACCSSCSDVVHYQLLTTHALGLFVCLQAQIIPLTTMATIDHTQMLSLFVTLRKFLAKCSSLPDPDRQMAVKVAAALCDVLAKSAMCIRQQAASAAVLPTYVASQLLPGLQVRFVGG